MFIEAIDVNTTEETMIIFGFQDNLDEFLPFIFRLEEIGVQINDPINRNQYMYLVDRLRNRCKPANDKKGEDALFLTYLFPNEMKKFMERLFNLCIKNTENNY